MGLESYIFSVGFKKPVDLEIMVDLFKELGATYLEEKSSIGPLESYRDFYFEIRTDRGLTEIHILLVPNKIAVTDFSLRFSILSPETVIDQSFEFLNRMKEKYALIVKDRQNKSKEIELDPEKFKLNEDNIMKLTNLLTNGHSVVVSGREESFEYLRKFHEEKAVNDDEKSAE